MIVVGLVAGMACGLFFGEYTESIKWIGDSYVGLLQMAVLPYVAASLVTNVGRLSLADSVRLLRTSVFVMLVLWAIGVLTLAIMTHAFPVWATGSFFSSRFTEEPPSPEWLDLFIPSNPFRSFANNSIPAVVVFCLGVGIALMLRPDKEKLLEPLQVLVDTLAYLNKLVVKTDSDWHVRHCRAHSRHNRTRSIPTYSGLSFNVRGLGNSSMLRRSAFIDCDGHAAQLHRGCSSITRPNGRRVCDRQLLRCSTFGY